MKFLKSFESIRVDRFGRKHYYQKGDYIYFDLSRSNRIDFESPYGIITHIDVDNFSEPYEIVLPFGRGYYSVGNTGGPGIAFTPTGEEKVKSFKVGSHSKKEFLKRKKKKDFLNKVKKEKEMKNIKEYNNWDTTAVDNIRINYGDDDGYDNLSDITKHTLKYIKDTYNEWKSISHKDNEALYIINYIEEKYDFHNIVIRMLQNKQPTINYFEKYNDYLNSQKTYTSRNKYEYTITMKDYKYLAKELDLLRDKKIKDVEINTDLLDKIVPHRKDAKNYNL